MTSLERGAHGRGTIALVDERPVTWSDLVRFHREMLVPDIERVLDARLAPIYRRFDDVDSHFDAIYQRLDRVESQIQSLSAAVKRV